MAYGPSLSEDSRRAGVMVGKILNGVNPAELPVEQPTKFDFVFNLKTAKALGITSTFRYSRGGNAGNRIDRSQS